MEIVESDLSLLITFHPEQASVWNKILLAINTFFSFLTAGYLLFFNAGNFTSLIWAFPVLIIFYVSLRSLLWSIRGKEVIEIEEKYIHQILDYGLFNEKSITLNREVGVKIDLQNTAIANDEKVLDIGTGKYTQGGIIRFVKKNNVLISTNSIISGVDLEIAENMINKYLK